jgi:hypothetical protein
MAEAALGWRLRWGRLAALGPTPITLLGLTALGLGPPAAGTGLGGLLVGLAPLVALERLVPALAAAALAPRRPPALDSVTATLALVAAALVHPGLVPIALLVAASLLVRERSRSTMVGALATALAAGLAVEAGSLLLGGERDLLPPATVGALVLFERLLRAERNEDRRAGGLDPAWLAPMRLAAFCLALALALALATERGLLGPEPSPWAVLTLPLLAAVLFARLEAAGRVRPARRRPEVGPTPAHDPIRSVTSGLWSGLMVRVLQTLDPRSGDRALRPARARRASDARDRP